MKDNLLLRFIIRETIGTIVLGVALFLSAGTIAWWPAWATVVITLIWVVATGIVIMRTNPDLLAERLGPRKGGKSWDTAIMSMVALLTLARLIVAGLDRRNDWTDEFSPILQTIALLICMLGYALAIWAIGSNAFFSQIVRIQSERQHTVASGGPYRFVRHPGYVGSILSELTLPLLLASWWAFLPGALNALLFVVRTSLEDRDLQHELDGYKAYADRVRYRLLPGIW